MIRQRAGLAARACVAGILGASVLGLGGAWAASPVIGASRLVSADDVPVCTTSWRLVAIPQPAGESVLKDGVPIGASVAGLSGTGAEDVWAVGSYVAGPSYITSTLAEHWTGSRWEITPTPDLPQEDGWTGNQLSSVVTLSASDAWAVGSAGVGSYGSDIQYSASGTLVEHWDGTAWAVVAAPDLTPDDELSSVSADGPDDVWAVGTAQDIPAGFDGVPVAVPLVEHWNGATWSLVTFPDPGLDPFDPTQTGPISQAIPGSRANAYEEASLTGVDAVSSDQVWVTGDLEEVQDLNATLVYKSFVSEWDGTAWSTSIVPTLAPAESGVETSQSVLAIASAAGSGVRVVGSAAPQVPIVVTERKGTQRVTSLLAIAGSGELDTISERGDDDIWAAGSSILHWNGKAWKSTFDVGGVAIDPITAVDAVSKVDVWAVGDGYFAHGDCVTPGRK